MFEIFLKTLPFFALIALGYGALRARILPQTALPALSGFVFYFALSAMLFKLAYEMPLTVLWNPALIGCYVLATGGLYGLQLLVSRLRGAGLAEAAIEAQCATIGNTGFLGVPMLAALLGPAVSATVLTALVIDMVLFSALVTLLVTFAQAKSPQTTPQAAGQGQGTGQGTGQPSLRLNIMPLLLGIARNPMIVSMLAGFAWAAIGLPMPLALERTLSLLGSAATPCALFAIGASLAGRQLDRIGVASWLAFGKMVLHPAAMALCAYWVFDLPLVIAGGLVAVAALPVAGNIYILAQHFGVAPQRVSSSILISTAASVLTIPLVIAWISSL